MQSCGRGFLCVAHARRNAPLFPPGNSRWVAQGGALRIAPVSLEAKVCLVGRRPQCRAHGRRNAPLFLPGVLGGMRRLGLWDLPSVSLEPRICSSLAGAAHGRRNAPLFLPGSSRWVAQGGALRFALRFFGGKGLQ